MEITVRRAEPRDLGAIRALLYQVNQIHADGRPDLFKSGGIKYTDAELDEILRDDDRPVFVATDGEDSVLGYVFCIPEETEENTSLRHVKTLYIDDQEIQDIIDFWIDKGADGFRIDVIDSISKDYSNDTAESSDRICMSTSALCSTAKRHRGSSLSARAM